jgi:hypothetical protein
MAEVLIILVLVNMVVLGNWFYKYSKSQEKHNHEVENLLRDIKESLSKS